MTSLGSPLLNNNSRGAAYKKAVQLSHTCAEYCGHLCDLVLAQLLRMLHLRLQALLSTAA